MRTNEQPTIRCNKCGWEGVEGQLYRMTDENNQVFDACPNGCETDAYLMDLD